MSPTPADQPRRAAIYSDPPRDSEIHTDPPRDSEIHTDPPRGAEIQADPPGPTPHSDAAIRSGDLILGEDGLARPRWAMSSPIEREYYDSEWGMPIRDDQGLYERICLEGFQSGLSWATILRKRENFRAAFANFDPDIVAAFDQAQVESLLQNAGIIRHRGKITATIGNAQATINLRAEGGLAKLVWSFQPEHTPVPHSVAEVGTTSAQSVALSKELRSRGFRFVGPTTMYALMEAVGIIDTHLVGSHRRGSSGVWS